VVFAAAPITAERSLELLRTIKLGRLLDGLRGREPMAAAELARAIACFSNLVHDGADELTSIEINPILVGRDAAVAVDAAAVLALGHKPEAEGLSSYTDHIVREANRGNEVD